MLLHQQKFVQSGCSLSNAAYIVDSASAQCNHRLPNVDVICHNLFQLTASPIRSNSKLRLRRSRAADPKLQRIGNPVIRDTARGVTLRSGKVLLWGKQSSNHRNLLAVSTGKMDRKTGVKAQMTGVSAQMDGEPQARNADVTFYTHTLCPYAHRVALTLIEKGVQAETIHIDLSNKPAWFRKVNPRGLVPALARGGKTLTESLDLCGYIDATFPGPQLMPDLPEGKLEAEDLIGRCDRFVSAGLQFLSDPGAGSWSLPKGKIPVKKTGSEVKAFDRELTWLEQTLQQHGGPFFMGGQLTLVDLVYFPFLDRFALAGPAFVDSNVCARFKSGAIERFLKAIRGRDSYKRTSASPEAHLAGYEKYRSLDYFDYVTASMENPCP